MHSSLGHENRSSDPLCAAHASAAAAQTLPPAAAAQSSPDSPTRSLRISLPAWGKAVIDSFNKPLHPVVGGVASGGGLGVGVGYDSPDDERLVSGGGSDGHHSAILVGGRGSRPAIAVEAIADRGVRHRPAHGPARLLRHRTRHGRSTIGPHSACAKRRSAPADGSACSGCSPRRQRIGLHARSRTSRARQFPRSKRFHATVDPRIRAEPIFGRYRGFAELRPSSTRRSGVAQRSEPLQGTYQLALEAVRDHDRASQLSSLGSGSAAAHSRSQTGPAAHAARLPCVHQQRRRSAVLHAVYTWRKRRAQVVPTRPARQRRHPRNAARISQLPVPRPGHPADAGRISHPDRTHRCTRRCSSTPARWPHVRQNYSAISERARDSASATCARKTLARMDVGFGGGEGVQVFWSFGAFRAI